MNSSRARERRRAHHGADRHSCRASGVRRQEWRIETSTRTATSAFLADIQAAFLLARIPIPGGTRVGIAQALTSSEESRLWTLEEIGRLHSRRRWHEHRREQILDDPAVSSRSGQRRRRYLRDSLVVVGGSIAQSHEVTMPKALRTTETRRRTTPVERTQPLQTYDAIATRAYELYVQRGGEPGRDWEDWFAAERDLRSPAGYGVTRGREVAHRPRAAPRARG
jgi:hypothetical protein